MGISLCCLVDLIKRENCWVDRAGASQNSQDSQNQCPSFFHTTITS
jgi:hypothetical protein